MKTITLFALLVPAILVSCESPNSRRAGGGAFDDSHLGPILDGNGPVPDPRDPTNQSLDDWRSIDE